jgi:hypothetical protein
MIAGGCADRMPVGGIRSGIRSEQAVQGLARSACPAQDCFSH